MAYIYASACIWPGGKCALRWRNFSSWCRSSASRPTPISLIISRRLSSRSSFPWCERPDPCKKRRGGKYPPLLSDHRNAMVARSHRMRTLLIESSGRGVGARKVAARDIDDGETQRIIRAVGGIWKGGGEGGR